MTTYELIGILETPKSRDEHPKEIQQIRDILTRLYQWRLKDLEISSEDKNGEVYSLLDMLNIERPEDGRPIEKTTTSLRRSVLLLDYIINGTLATKK